MNKINTNLYALSIFIIFHPTTNSYSLHHNLISMAFKLCSISYIAISCYPPNLRCSLQRCGKSYQRWL